MDTASQLTPLDARGLVDESIAIDDRPGAYQWWYFDATSDDGEWALVVLFFVGSVFSPWYAQRLRAGETARPSEHPAVNVALYRRGRPHRWAFNERGRGAADPLPDAGLRIGASEWRRARDGSYEISIDEPLVRFDRRGALRGVIRFVPESPAATMRPLVLDAKGEHRWHCVAPRCRVEVSLREPAIQWSGVGYHDINHGDVPLAHSFHRWTWARTHGRRESTVRYDRTLRDGSRRVLEMALPADHRGATRIHDFYDARAMPLRTGGWLLAEPATFHIREGAAVPLRRVDSSPFYARYSGRLGDGESVIAEHLDLDRFDHPIVQWMLPYRARRESRG